jgi:hypothetical protein
MSLENFKSILIIGTTEFEANGEKILSAKQFQTSYWIKYFCSAQTFIKILFLWGKQFNLHALTFKYDISRYLLILNHSF